MTIGSIGTHTETGPDGMSPQYRSLIEEWRRAPAAGTRPRRPDLTLERRSWVTSSQEVVPDDVPTHYVDSANETEFPRNAIIPKDLAATALIEFAETGVRSESVQWQPFDTY
ncbi:Imm1 family immunity protein [Lentzea sp. NPDC102401]|uniref:Imm1 family immunity protein n=1 Tax=Lentzea sp. NPDC102401 TaxID=3364128 RepID=UPI0038205B78